jgi:chemotaxis protein MotB
VITRVTDEGLIIEIFDLPNAPLFEPDTAMPTDVTVELTDMFARVFSVIENGIAVSGHTQSRPVVFSDNPVWALSTDRAQAIRELLEQNGLDEERIHRVVGHADRKAAIENPVSERNNRIEIIVLRSDT